MFIPGGSKLTDPNLRRPCVSLGLLLFLPQNHSREVVSLGLEWLFERKKTPSFVFPCGAEDAFVFLCRKLDIFSESRHHVCNWICVCYCPPRKSPGDAFRSLASYKVSIDSHEIDIFWDPFLPKIINTYGKKLSWHWFGVAGLQNSLIFPWIGSSPS